MSGALTAGCRMESGKPLLQQPDTTSINIKLIQGCALPSTSISSNSAPSSSTTPLPQAIIALAAPPSAAVASAAHQQLLIQSVHALRASSRVAAQRKLKREKEMILEGLLPPDAATSRPGDPNTAGEGSDEGLRRRLDAMGFRVGGDLAER